MLNPSFPDIKQEDFTILPLAQSETIPSRWYTDPRFHELDQQALFSKHWHYVGHTSKLRNPGDQIIASIADNPILLVRGNDNKLRAFYNVCRHRGGPIALEDCTTKVLQCKYHGWTYLLDGSLRGTPKFDRTELFDKKDYGLVPLKSDTWEEMIFVNLSDGSSKIHDIFKGIRERIAPVNLASMKFHSRVIYDVHCNWKVYVDNYLEGYHLPFVHPELTSLLDYQNYLTETFEHYSLQHSAIQQEDGIYGKGDAYYFFVFPNFMLNILPGRFQTNVVIPNAPNRCKVIFDYYYEDRDSPDARKRIADDLAYSDKVQQEDAEICERVQIGLASRAYDKGRFSVDMENGVYHFQALLKKAYRVALEL